MKENEIEGKELKMNVYDLEKMAIRLYPDERIPVESGNPAIAEPDRIISH